MNIRRLLRTKWLVIALSLLCWTNCAPFLGVLSAPTNLAHIERNTIKLFYEYYNGAEKRTVWGTATFIGERRILTVYHLTDANSDGKFYSYIKIGKNTEIFTFKIESYDKKKDLMTLKSDKKINWKPIEIAEEMKLGEMVVFVGYTPYHLPKIRFGFLSFHSQYGIMIIPAYYGDSGGPILKASNGKLVGVINRLYFIGKNYTTDYCVGYGADLNKIKDFLNVN